MTEPKVSVVGIDEETRQNWLKDFKPEERLSRALHMDGGLAEYDATVPVGDFSAPAESQSVAGRSLALAEGFGMIASFNYLNKFTETAMTKWLAERKESGDYKGQEVLDRQGRVVVLVSFEQLCEAAGISARTAYERIQNLHLLGEETLEKAKGLGLGVRELRKLRALPDEARQLVIEGEKVGDDPEALKDLLEDLVVRHTAEKSDLKAERDRLKADNEAQAKVMQRKNSDLDQLQTRLAALENIAPDEARLLQSRRERNAIEELHRQGLMMIGQMGAYLAQLGGILDDRELSPACRELAQNLTQGLCRNMAEDLIDGGADVDFRYYVFPPELENIPQREMLDIKEFGKAVRDGGEA